MKKLIKYMCLCFLVIGLYSCEQEDEGIIKDEGFGANTFLLDNSISILDQNEDLEIRLFSKDVQFESIEVLDKDGNVLATPTLSDSTATFNASVLGDLAAGDAVDLWIESTLSNGEVIRQPTTLSVTDAITLEDNPGTVQYLDTTSTALSFSTSTFAAPVDNVSLFRKTTEDADYVATDETFDVEGDALNLGDIDYEELGVGVGDTIFYRFEAVSGEFNQAVETQVVITTQDFQSGTTATTLSDEPSMSGFNLSTGEYAAADETGEIVFMEPSGFEATMDEMDFVQVTVPEDMTASEYIESLDLFETEMIYEEGNPMNSVEQVEVGDVYIYKTTREGTIFYGIIRIGNVTSTIVNGEETTRFDLNYIEGTIIRE